MICCVIEIIWRAISFLRIIILGPIGWTSGMTICVAGNKNYAAPAEK